MRKVILSGLIALGFIGLGMPVTPASADPQPFDHTDSGTATAYGLTGLLGGTEVIPPTPEVSVTAPPFGDDASTDVIDLSPLSPLTGNGAVNADARVHQAADIDTLLEGTTQPVAGPYNAQAMGSAEDLEVLVDAVAAGVPVVEADLIRAEAVGKCVGNTAQYSAATETENLVIADSPDLGDAIDELLDQLFPGLDPLDPIVNVEEDLTEVTATSASATALRITVLEAAGEDPLVEVLVGHAEVSGLACTAGGPGDLPECSDGIDNDGDGVIDIDDPGCHTDNDPNNPDSYDPNDDDETDGFECSDTRDNDGDGKIDFPDDPECDSPEDDREAGDDGIMARTGTSIPTAAATGLGLGALALYALRRRTA